MQAEGGGGATVDGGGSTSLTPEPHPWNPILLLSKLIERTFGKLSVRISNCSGDKP